MGSVSVMQIYNGCGFHADEIYEWVCFSTQLYYCNIFVLFLIPLMYIFITVSHATQFSNSRHELWFTSFSALVEKVYEVFIEE